MRARLNMYDLEMWSILRERETCAASVRELEEVLAAEESTDEEAELRDEKSRYDAKRVVTTRQEVVEEDKDGDEDESEEEGEEEEDEDEDEPVRQPYQLLEDFKPRQLPTWLMSSFEAIARSAKKYSNFRQIFRCWAAGCNRMGWLVRV